MLLSILSVILISFISLIVLISLSKLNIFSKHLNLFLALASGTLLGDIFIHILPELSSDGFHLYSLIILFSIFLNYFVESIMNLRHCHNIEHKHTLVEKSKRSRLIISDIIHNLLDGITLFASFTISFPLGIATSVAIILHEIPKEISSFVMMLNTGVTKKKGILINSITALSGIIGIIISKFLNMDIHSEYLLAFVAGNFLYIALVDIFPELHGEKDTKSNILKLILFALGIGLMYLLKILFS